MNRQISVYAIGLALAFAGGRMTIGSAPIESRSFGSAGIEAGSSPAVAQQQLVPVCEQRCDALPAADPIVSDPDRPSTRGLEQAIAALDAARMGEDEASRLHAVRELWVAAADAGAPSNALDALESIRNAPRVGERLQREVDRAREDLDRLIESRQSRTDSPGWQDPAPEAFDPDPALAADSEGDPHTDAILLNRFALDLDDPEPVVRLDAVRGLARHRRDEVPEILLRAVHDHDTGVRLETVRSLWVVAADGFDRDGEIVRSLEYASRDRDDRVRAVAEQALVDLANLAR